MGTIIEYENIVAFHPGYYIAEVIEDMGISQSEFANGVGITTQMLSDIVSGQADISYDIAKKLSVLLGTSTDVWFNLQNTNNCKRLEIQQIQDFDE